MSDMVEDPWPLESGHLSNWAIVTVAFHYTVCPPKDPSALRTAKAALDERAPEKLLPA